MAVTHPDDAVPEFSIKQEPHEQNSAFVEEMVADHILGDQPATNETEDRLGFKPYVEAVAKFLSDESTKVPLTMSVEGVWGSGKSSFMRLLQQRLYGPGKRRFVNFEAWRYSPDEGLWAAFLDAFDSQLRGGLRGTERLKARWRLVKLRLSLQGAMDSVVSLAWMAAAFVVAVSVAWFAIAHLTRGLNLHHLFPALTTFLQTNGTDAVDTLKGISGLAAAIAAVVVFLSKLGEILKSPAALSRTRKLWGRPDFHERLPLIQEMTTNLQSLIEAYVGDETVFVFIDDLDRCEYMKAAELIQGLLQLISSAPKVALIVGLDRDKVSAAMAAKQEKLLPYLYNLSPTEIYGVGNEYGQRFLEKFIQVSYVLPMPQADGLKAMINPDATPPAAPPAPGVISTRAVRVATGKDDTKTLNALIEMANQAFYHNPRNVKQFVNMFRLQAFIASETGLFEDPEIMKESGTLLTVPQLAKFVALCMRWPRFVEAVLEDDGLLAETEAGAARKAKGVEAATSDAAKLWLSDRNLVALLSFRSEEPGFRLASVDIHTLTSVAPARVTYAGPRPASGESQDRDTVRPEREPPE